MSEKFTYGLMKGVLIAFFIVSKNAQDENHKPENFQINIRTSIDKIILKCKEGFARTTLIFPKSKTPQVIDEFGMKSIENFIPSKFQ